MTKKELKAVEKRVEQAYYRTCQGIQINIMDIGKVFQHGVEAVTTGFARNDEELETVVKNFVQTIRKN